MWCEDVEWVELTQDVVYLLIFCEYMYETSGYIIAENLLAKYQLSKEHSGLASSRTHSTSVFKAWAQQLMQLHRPSSNTVLYLTMV
jgi:hypothetical protein